MHYQYKADHILEALIMVLSDRVNRNMIQFQMNFLDAARCPGSEIYPEPFIHLAKVDNFVSINPFHVLNPIQRRMRRTLPLRKGIVPYKVIDGEGIGNSPGAQIPLA
jgi:hypothetical protein